MARQDRWSGRSNEDRRYRDDDNRDWRGAGDDWRRGEAYRSGRRDEGGSDIGGGRDYSDYSTSEEVRRRDINGYGGANRDASDPSYREQGYRDFGSRDQGYDDRGYREPWRGERGFAWSEADRYGSERPGGTYGPGTYEGGRGSSFRGRDDWSSGGYGGRRSGWSDDNWSGNRGDERGFFERASDEVASWFGDEDAERRRNQDQHRGKGPKGYTRSDDRIREDVNDRLTDDPFVDASEIEVTVTAAEVTLGGFVSRRDQRRRAEDAAERVSGVLHVQNNIRVRGSGDAGVGERGLGSTIGEKAFGRDTSTGELAGRSMTGGTDTGTAATDTASTRKASL